MLARIELERAKEAFGKERRLLLLQISELEEESNAQRIKLNESSQQIDLKARIKLLEEENYRVTQLYQAGLHKIEYYATLIKGSNPENKENSGPTSINS